MSYRPESYRTPWQKVLDKFGMKPAQLAAVIGRHRSKVSRAVRDPKGLISGRDQELILDAARRCGVNVTPDDLTPHRA